MQKIERRSAEIGVKLPRQEDLQFRFVDVGDEGQIVAWCRERMANFKVPRRVVVLERLPVNASGKVLKSELRAMAKRA